MFPGKERKHKIQEENMLSEDVNLGAVESLRNWWRKALGTLLKKKYDQIYWMLPSVVTVVTVENVLSILMYVAVDN
jgi:hypothetical protein